MPPKSPRARCALISSLAVLLISVALSVAVLEWGIRIVLPHFDPTGQIEFTHLPDGMGIGPVNTTLRQVKNTRDFDVQIRFNALGWRDDKLVSQSGERSIFAVGDSFTFGWGVEQVDRFSDRLGKRLGRDVFNIAIPGDLDDYADLIRLAERNGATIRTLVVGVCMENDLLDYSARTKITPIAPNKQTGPTAWISQWKPWLRDNSALYFLLTSVVHGNPTLKAMAVKAGLLVPNLQLSSLTLSDATVRVSAERLNSLVAGRKAVILIIPARHLWVGDEASRAAMAHVHDTFVGAITAEGLVVVDPRPHMEAGGNPLTYHFTNDGHWNAKGHDLASAMLAERITQLGW